MDWFVVCLYSETEGAFWLEFYWADNGEHAEEQAQDANPNDQIVALGYVPGTLGRDNEGQVIVYTGRYDK